MRLDRTSVFLIILAILGMFLLSYATRWDIGVSPDSTFYLEGATNISQGHGYSIRQFDNKFNPITHYPPGFPLAIVLLIQLGLNSVTAARILNIVLFGANIILIGLLVQRATERSLYATVACSILALFTPFLLHAHVMALSEPLFLFSLLLGVLLVLNYLDKPENFLLLGFSVSIAIATLTRYQGIAMIPPILVVLTFWNKRNKGRIKACLVFLTISSLPLVLLFIRNLVYTGYAMNGPLTFHFLLFDHMNKGLYYMSTWLIPETVPGVIKQVALGIFLIGFIALFFHLNTTIRMVHPLQALLLLFVASYWLVLLVAGTLLYADIAFDPRYMMPVYISLLIIIASLIYSFVQRHPGWKFVFLVIWIYLLIGFAWQSIPLLRRYHEEGIDFSSRRLKESKLIRTISGLPMDVRVFTNAPSAVQYLTRHWCDDLPRFRNQSSLLPNTQYEQQMDGLEKLIVDRRAVIAYFYSMDWALEFPTERQLQKRLSLKLLWKDREGAIYGQ